MQGLTDTRDIRREAGAIRPWIPAVAVGLAALTMSVAVEARPRDATQAAAVFPPWWSAAHCLDAAARAGAVVAVGAVPFIIVVRSARGAIGTRLRESGAWLALDPALAGPCGA